MKRVTVDGVELAYLERGSGPETVVFSHSYLVDHRHFLPQIHALSEHYRVIAFDHRDHGQSAMSSTHYGLDDLVSDAVGLIDAVVGEPCHFVGLSTGGFVGMRIALRYPGRLLSLVLMDTDARSERTLLRIRNKLMLMSLRLFGAKPLMGQTMKLMFGPSFRADDERREEAELWKSRMAANDTRALIRFGSAIFARDDVLADLGSLRLPTLIMAGEHDRALAPGFRTKNGSGYSGRRVGDRAPSGSSLYNRTA